MRKIVPPTSIKELEQRAQELAGKKLGELARLSAQVPPPSLHYAKGWIGQLLEIALGANAANLDQPDFLTLGIELKTLPLTPSGQPCESTFLCTAPIPPKEWHFKKSAVWRKLAHVLWIPIEANKTIPLTERRIGTPLFWQPSIEITQALQQDWEELNELLLLGHFENLSAHKGRYLQLRPKAANSKSFIQVVNHEGESLLLIPKGFYLRPTFTQWIIQTHYTAC